TRISRRSLPRKRKTPALSPDRTRPWGSARASLSESVRSARVQTVLFLQHVLNGLLAGTYYLLIALGLSLIFSLGGIVNLAHGAFYAIGGYLTVVLSPSIGFFGSIVASPVVVGILGVLIERTLFRRFYKADPSLSLILTFGLAMVAEQLLRMVFGAP